MSGRRFAAPEPGDRTTWGFHRLSPDWAERVVAAAGVRRGELVVDVGAGEGALTYPLLAAGARVIAVELHAGRAARLRAALADEPRVSVLNVDVRDFRWPRRPVRVVANPSFAIVGDLLRILRRHRTLTAADLVMPRAAVRRHVDRAGHRVQLRSGINLPRSAFTPRPPLDCGVLQLRRQIR